MKKGEIWIVELYDAEGHEQRGIRPCLILGSANGLVTIVPLTTNVSLSKLSHTHLIEPTQENGLTQNSIALVFQIVAVDQNKFKKQIGWIPKGQREAIDQLIKDLMKIS